MALPLSGSLLFWYSSVPSEIRELNLLPPMLRIPLLIAFCSLLLFSGATAKPYVDNIDAEESDSHLLDAIGESYAQAFLSRNFSREVSGVRLALEKVGATPLGIQVSLHEHDQMNDRPGNVIVNFGNTAYDGAEGPFVFSNPATVPVNLGCWKTVLDFPW